MPKSTMRAADDETDGWPAGGVPGLVGQPVREITCCPGHAGLQVNDRITQPGPHGPVEWVVKGWDKETGRLWVHTAKGYTTRFLDCMTVEQPACTPEDSPVCTCGFSANGFHADPEDPAMWVHSTCGKPTALFLQSRAAREGMVKW